MKLTSLNIDREENSERFGKRKNLKSISTFYPDISVNGRIVVIELSRLRYVSMVIIGSGFYGYKGFKIFL